MDEVGFDGPLADEVGGDGLNFQGAVAEAEGDFVGGEVVGEGAFAAEDPEAVGGSVGGDAAEGE